MAWVFVWKSAGGGVLLLILLSWFLDVFFGAVHGFQIHPRWTFDAFPGQDDARANDALRVMISCWADFGGWVGWEAELDVDEHAL